MTEKIKTFPEAPGFDQESVDQLNRNLLEELSRNKDKEQVVFFVLGAGADLTDTAREGGNDSFAITTQEESGSHLHPEYQRALDYILDEVEADFVGEKYLYGERDNSIMPPENSITTERAWTGVFDGTQITIVQRFEKVIELDGERLYKHQAYGMAGTPEWVTQRRAAVALDSQSLQD